MVVKILEEEMKGMVVNINGHVLTSWDIYNQMLPFKNTTTATIPILNYEEIYDLLKNFGRHLYIERGNHRGKLLYVIYLNMGLAYPDRKLGYRPIAYTDNTKDLLEYLHYIWCIPINKLNKKPETLKEVNKWIKGAGGGFKISVERSGLGSGHFVLINEYVKQKHYFEANSIDEIINEVMKTYAFIVKTWIDR